MKEKQVIIYAIALMLITAGYLNYMGNNKNKEENEVLATSTNVTEDSNNTSIAQTNATDENIIDTNAVDSVTELGDIGDAALVSSDDVVENYFANSKLERDKMYSQMIEVYQNVLNASTSQEAQKQTATEEIQKINNNKNSIMICENLLKTKGFDDSVIFINGESINVIVGAVELEKEQVAEIQKIIQREIGADAKNIHITMK